MTRITAVGLVILCFLALGLGGWDSWLAASGLAIAPLAGVLGLALSPNGRDAIWGAKLPRFAALLFAVTFGVVVFQCLPLPPGLAHPAWGLLGTFKFDPATMDVFATRVEIGKLAGLAAAFLIGVAVGRDPRNVSWLVRVALVCGLLFAMWFLAARAFAIAHGASTTERLNAGLGSANVAATILGSIVLIALAVIVRLSKEAGAMANTGVPRSGLTWSGLAWVGLAMALAALLLTASRGGILATCLGVGVFIALEAVGMRGAPQGGARRWLLGPLAVSAGVVLVGSAMVAIYGQTFLERLQGIHNLSASGRAEIFAAHWHAFLQLPWLGHGLGTFASINNVYMPRQYVKVLQDAGAAHNVYLQWLEEGGLLGAVPLFACVAILIAGIGRGLARRRRERTWLRLGLALAVLVAVHSFVEFTLNVYAAAVLAATLLGVFWSLGQT